MRARSQTVRPRDRPPDGPPGGPLGRAVRRAVRRTVRRNARRALKCEPARKRSVRGTVRRPSAAGLSLNDKNHKPNLFYKKTHWAKPRERYAQAPPRNTLPHKLKKTEPVQRDFC